MEKNGNKIIIYIVNSDKYDVKIITNYLYDK